MTETTMLLRRTMAFRRAAADGALAATEVFADALKADGYPAQISTALDGTVSVSLEGASAIAREFGTLRREAWPVMGPKLYENRARMVSAMANAFARAVRERAP